MLAVSGIFMSNDELPLHEEAQQAKTLAQHLCALLAEEHCWRAKAPMRAQALLREAEQASQA